jgi:STE24 endopeptidase
VRLVAPIFNKYTPLENAALHESILATAHGVGANITKVEIEDTSKRETRTNAYVGGMGKARRMVVCDNMLAWPEEQVRWVCAHEIGHWKRQHIMKLIPVALLMLLVDFVVLKLILTNHSVLDFAGVKTLGDPASLALFMFVFPLPGRFTGLVPMFMSRAHEREADLFGLEAVPDPKSAAASFRQLVTDNIGDLTPSLWRRIKHSHPQTAERLAMIAEWERRNAASG